ncbi:MAG: hypothetical protein Ct9H300mP1_37020 [Planctomycetaceae bacterium]|nr:MAG: hypothetical protein Ct9H300mP1_37020 [Planctomycetaceae bacterium]
MPHTFDIAVIEGDGIGPQVTREAIRSVEAAAALDDATFEWTSYPRGPTTSSNTARWPPMTFPDTLAKHDAILWEPSVIPMSRTTPRSTACCCPSADDSTSGLPATVLPV